MARISLALGVALGLVMSVVPAGRAPAQETGEITINEIRIDQPSGDIDEYFELSGPPGELLTSTTYLVIGDTEGGGSGVIEAAIDLDGSAIGSSGFFVAAESTFTLGTADLTTALDFENSDNVTHLLVQGFSGATGDDLDTNDDGVLDATPWGAELDRVALVEEDNPPTATEYHYGPPSVGPDGSFVPGHVYNCPDPDGWQIGEFDPVAGEDTPGSANDCGDEPPPSALELEIYTVQGSGMSSDYVTQSVLIDGVVVGDFQGSGLLNGFHLQEAEGDENPDGSDNTATSNGIFVFAPGAPDVEIGDLVEVTGTVVEFDQMTEISDVTEVEIVGAGEVEATVVSLPVEAQSDWEKYEGMLITFDTQPLYISEFFNFDRTNEIVLTSDRQYQGTQVAEPGEAANDVAAANALARITLDDARTSQNPDPALHPDGGEFTLTNTFRGGDILEDVTGVMHESRPYFAFFPPSINYRIQPTQGAEHVAVNPRPTSPAAVGGDLRVATFNVLNFFTHLDDGVNDICGPTGDMECRGADTQEELDRQLAKLVAGIIALDADVVGIQEVENDIYPEEIDGNRAHDAVRTLVEALNAAEGQGTWAWAGEANHYNDYPVRNDLIYRRQAVVAKGSPMALAHNAFDRTRPEAPDEPVGRPPLAQTFLVPAERGRPEVFTVVVNHFKSKGSSCTNIGDPDVFDGQANCNITRVAQANALLDFVGDLQEDSGDPDVLVIGDLNSYAMEDPIQVLEGGGFTDLVRREADTPRVYTYLFDGQLGTLDYIMANETLLDQVEGVTVFHINADEPDILDYDTSFKRPAQDDLYESKPYRVSDHDPVIVGLTLESEGVPGRGTGPPPGRGPR